MVAEDLANHKHFAKIQSEIQRLSEIPYFPFKFNYLGTVPSTTNIFDYLNKSYEIQGIVFGYKDGERLGLGNSAGRASETGTNDEIVGGTIRLNAVVLNLFGDSDQVRGYPNVVVHELLHMLGMPHNTRWPRVVEQALMHPHPKVTKLGWTYDDITDIYDNYGIKIEGCHKLTVDMPPDAVSAQLIKCGFFNKAERSFSVSVKDGKAVFNNVIPGKYYLMINNASYLMKSPNGWTFTSEKRLKKNFKVKKDRTITLA